MSFTKENDKKVNLLGDFKIALKIKASESLDIIYTANLLPHNISPTRFKSRVNIYTDSIITNSINDNCN